jgi:hypothetical protein
MERTYVWNMHVLLAFDISLPCPIDALSYVV